MYARRKVIAEPVFGRLKHNWGFRRLLLRGRTGASSEWLLVCLGHNLRKWAQGVGLTPVLAPLFMWLRRVPSLGACRFRMVSSTPPVPAFPL